MLFKLKYTPFHFFDFLTFGKVETTSVTVYFASMPKLGILNIFSQIFKIIVFIFHIQMLLLFITVSDFHLTSSAR